MSSPSGNFQHIKKHLDFIKGLSEDASREGKTLFREAHRYRVVAAGGGIVMIASQFDSAVWQAKILIVLAVFLCLLSLYYSYLAVSGESHHQAKLSAEFNKYNLGLLERAREFLDTDASIHEWSNSVEFPQLREPIQLSRYREWSLIFLRQAAVASLAYMVTVLVQEI